jgi:hypothetical protein
MYCGCGRVYPAKLFGSRHLFAVQRPRHRNVSIGNLVEDVIIRAKLYRSETREIALEAFDKPVRRAPKIKPVM